MRLGKLMTKVGIAFMLSEFSFEVVDKKYFKEELKLKRQDVPTKVAEPLDIKVSLR